MNTGVYRPVINDGKDEQANLPSDGSTVDPLHGFIPAAISGPPTGPIQVKPLENRIRTWKNTCVACSDPSACRLVFPHFLLVLISICQNLLESLVPYFYSLVILSIVLIFKVPTAHAQGLEGPKWVSRWASLADGYAEPGSTPAQGECLEGAVKPLF